MIRQARLKAGLTQVECAKKVGISQGMLSAYENGTENLTVAQIERIFGVLDLAVLFYGKSKDEQCQIVITQINPLNDLPA